MYLKSIEVHGFKSFANKLLFEFHNGITAIVGPNGSGKSNVADAVRWVLGEQSAKQLRGAKMEDVIFSGTQLRKPLGFAYVAITLDNSDHKLPVAYEEVTVARRVYRSGESEYLMNGTSCRLRDVQELFLDTGIGKEGYSIIGQGQIDKILSGKPEERRELFDEAAGIVKFKKRKAAAEKNLEAEQLNLSRVRDILSELLKQIGPLEKQSGIAKEYLTLKEELKKREVNLFLAEHDRIQGEKEAISEKLVISTGDLSETKKAYDSTKEEYEKLELVLEEFSVELEEAKGLAGESRLKKEQLEGRIQVLKEQLAGAGQNDSHYHTRMEAVLTELAQREKELGECEEKRLELEEKIREKDQVYSEAGEQAGRFKKEMELLNQKAETLKSDIFEILNGNTSLKTQKQRYETMLEQDMLKRAGLNQKLLQYKSDETAFEEALGKQKLELSNLSKAIKGIETEKEMLSEKANEYGNRSRELKEKLDTLQHEIIREKSRLDSLKNMTERYEGYGQSIRRVMEQKKTHPGLIGVVADIVKTESRYETAIETALGGSIQNIVTDGENTAKDMIAFLKKNKYGRATFLPLTAIRGASFPEAKALSEEGAVGTASSLVEAEPRFEKLVQYLLGRILVVDHIDHAIAISRKYRNTLRIVTLEGDLLSPGGSMSGGAYKNSGNLLGRRRELEDMEKRIAAARQSAAQITEKMDSLKKDREHVRLQIQENAECLQRLYLEQNTARLKMNQAENDVAAVREGFEDIRRESSLLDTQIQELKASSSDLDQKLLQNESMVQEKEVAVEEATRLMEEKGAAYEKAREEANTIQMEFSSLEQEKKFLSETMDRIREEAGKFKKEQEGLRESLQASREFAASKQREIEQLEKETASCQKEIETTEKKISEILEEKERVSGKHKNFFEEREQLSSRIIELERENGRLQNQLEKLSDQLEQQMNYMWEEYELTLNGALPYRTEPSLPAARLKKETGELKARIKELGEVNVNAIEDYKNLSARYDLLKSQHDDLAEAEAVLKGIIVDLDQEMRRQFEEKFQEIRERFDLVFKELFGGGKGTLALMEDEDILEAGVRIIAQPPGKKLQNMMQLSGGEKALTAIALLFAIQSLKPSPFCLLDEIEAALDDSNVSRFAKYLHKLTRDTQFIVITHRRGTMAAADILYGITMQEKGVSTLVSVSLIEGELEKEERENAG